MTLRADKHADRGRADQAALVDVPAHSGKDAVAGGSQRSDVRHLTPGHKTKRHSIRQPEKLRRPCARHLLGDRG